MAFLSSLLGSIVGSVELGLMYAIMALGVYLTYRVLDFPDLTVDGSFTTGAGIAAGMIVAGYSPWLATGVAFLGGLAAGAVTGLLHTKGGINPLLSGILMMIALYTINYRIMGRPNIPLLNQETVFPDGSLFLGSTYALLMAPIIVLVLKLLLDWFLRTDLGMAIRATGDNARMVRSFGVNTDNTIVTGVSLSNGLVAMAGAFVAQYQGFADLQMGIGMIVIGLASVIIGEVIFGVRSIWRTTLAVILGAVVYRIVIALSIRYGLEASDMKLMTALIVTVALIVPMVNKRRRQRLVGRKRSLELTEEAGT
ncbi:ABC transporter permease [Paenibacillus antri]|uniref:ABC transporter permease n=1 Tax=Paenibacillus antri TaxID=2582848 RepID=A0A5R9GC59_9BACL|nr:ABC transporter permease [Paenibacillus antri]TLS50253.1 ABC transporter permease [Paenibacillus antri]